MNSLWMSGSEKLSTKVAGDRDSFQMVNLYVVTHLAMWSFFSTSVANIFRRSMITLFKAFCHQRVDLIVKFLHIKSVFSWYSSNLRIWRSAWFRTQRQGRLGRTCVFFVEFFFCSWKFYDFFFVSSLQSAFPVNPFSSSSSAIATKDSKFSWST